MAQTLDASPRRCGIVGHPVAHSVSPAMYRAAFARCGLPWTYEAIDVPEGGLAGFVGGLDATWRGLSVTMPHKQDVLRLGTPDETSRLVGAANTLVLEDDGTRSVRNTDVAGVVGALRGRRVESVGTAVIAGAGATARSVLAGLARLGLRDVLVQLRDVGKAGPMVELARTLGVAIRLGPIGEHAGCDVVVSTLPARVADAWAEALAEGAGAVFDAVYDPWPTALNRAAHAAGAVVVDGLDLVSAQAVDQIAALCGCEVAAADLRAAALAELSGRGKQG